MIRTSIEWTHWSVNPLCSEGCRNCYAQTLVRRADAGVPAFVKQIPLNGKVSHDPSKWPEELRVRQTAQGQEQRA